MDDRALGYARALRKWRGMKEDGSALSVRGRGWRTGGVERVGKVVLKRDGELKKREGWVGADDGSETCRKKRGNQGVCVSGYQVCMIAPWK